MWNRSYRWQRRLRVGTGIAVLCCLVVGLVLVANTSAARRARAGAEDLAGELRDAPERIINVAVPASLEPRVGTLVYQERADGGSNVIGRVVGIAPQGAEQVELTIRLMSSLAGGANAGGVLKGAPSSLDLRDALRLLVTPGTPAEEAIRARDTIWPSVQAHVLPGMIDGLIATTSEELGSLDQQDEALFAKSISRLREALTPFEDELVDRWAKRTWDTVGMQGLAAGILRQTAGEMQNQSASAARWWWRLLGNKTEPAGKAVERPFFSDETREELRAALEQETYDYWQENREAIIRAVRQVIAERRPDFEAAFKDRWAGLLYEKAILPAWESGQDQVLESVQTYANDFASRRLLTSEGGPRLMFAYALRSSLKISSDPLLLFVPGKGDAVDGVTFEPLLR
jgi:hypothetical protein